MMPSLLQIYTLTCDSGISMLVSYFSLYDSKRHIETVALLHLSNPPFFILLQGSRPRCKAPECTANSRSLYVSANMRDQRMQDVAKKRCNEWFLEHKKIPSQAHVPLVYWNKTVKKLPLSDLRLCLTAKQYHLCTLGLAELGGSGTPSPSWAWIMIGQEVLPRASCTVWGLMLVSPALEIIEWTLNLLLSPLQCTHMK